MKHYKLLNVQDMSMATGAVCVELNTAQAFATLRKLSRELERGKKIQLNFYGKLAVEEETELPYTNDLVMTVPRKFLLELLEEHDAEKEKPESDIPVIVHTASGTTLIACWCESMGYWYLPYDLGNLRSEVVRWKPIRWSKKEKEDVHISF